MHPCKNSNHEKLLHLFSYKDFLYYAFIYVSTIDPQCREHFQVMLVILEHHC